MNNRRKYLNRLFGIIYFIASFLLLSSHSFADVPGVTVTILSEPSPVNDSCFSAANDSLSRFIRFDHFEKSGATFMVKLDRFNSDFERLFFYEMARGENIYMGNKSDFHNDSALFLTGYPDEKIAFSKFSELFENTRKANLEKNEAEKETFVENSPFFRDRKHPETHPDSGQKEKTIPKTPVQQIIPCTSAQVACSENIYSFAQEYNNSEYTPIAPPSVDNYPNYGCLGGQPCPTWYYMKVVQPGDIIISIQQTLINPPPPNPDVDFICWGPFTSLTAGCESGLTGTCHPTPACCDNTNCPPLFYPKGNIVDCSFSGAGSETCNILGALPGQFYILLITNWSTEPGNITFSQTNVGGVTDCNIVTDCSVVAITATPSTCDQGTNTFSVSGNIEFSNAPGSGILTITDITAVPPVSQDLPFPFTSPLAYNLAGIPCDGAVHSLTAFFSAEPTCTLTQTYNSPGTCPTAIMTIIPPDGNICNDGSQATVVINFTGSGPYDFTYNINGGIDIENLGYNGPFPYTLNTGSAGTYTMVSVSNLGCAVGSATGSATVNLVPVPAAPVATSTEFYRCGAGSQTLSVTTEPGAVAKWYDAATGGTVLFTGNSFVTPSIVSTTIYYAEAARTVGAITCPSVRIPITAEIRPVPEVTNNTLTEGICTGGSPTIVLASSVPGTSFAWTATSNPPGRVTGFTPSTAAGSLITEVLNLNGGVTQPGDVVYSVTPTLASCSGTLATFTITVNPVPTVNPVSEQAFCQNSLTTLIPLTGNIPGTQYNWVNTNPSIGLAGSGTGDIPVFMATIPGTTPVTASITVTPVFSSAGKTCQGTPTSFTITINPVPIVNAVTSQVVCHGTQTVAIAFSGSIPTADYNWVNTDPSIGIGANGTGNIPAFTANNTGINPVTANITVTPSYTNAGKTCQGIPALFTISVNPVPTVNPVSDQPAVCHNTMTTMVSFSGSLPTAVYNWTNSNPAIGLGASGSGNILPFLATNLTNLPATAIITVTPSATLAGKTCSGTPASFMMTVNPIPGTAASVTGQNVVCQGYTGITYTSAVIPGATEYIWSYSGSGVSGQANTQNIIIDYSAAATSGNWNVFGRNACGDGALMATGFPVTVNPKPTAYFQVCTPLKTVKNGRKIQLKGGFPLPGVYSAIEGVSLNGGTGLYEFDPSVVTGFLPKDIQITYRFTNSQNCFDEKTQTINVSQVNADIISASGMKDLRDNSQYSYTTYSTGLSTRKWMTQNLNYGTRVDVAQPQADNCVAEKYCPPSDPACTGPGGGYYQWNELMEYQVGQGYQDICPPGWHVPSEAEWQDLIDNFDPNFTGASANGAIGAELTNTGQNFKALLEGINYLNAGTWSFTTGMTASLFWTSTLDINGKAIARGLNLPYNPSISKYPSSPANAFPVRCVKD